MAQLVAHLVWDQGVAGSNPVAPTTIQEILPLTGGFVLSAKLSVTSVCKNSVIRGVAQLVAHLVWDQGVAGSNPVAPTTIQEILPLTGGFVLSAKLSVTSVCKNSVIRGVAQLVAHLVWDQGVAGSNPVAPTI